MKEGTSPQVRAEGLMRVALSMLDDADEKLAAAHLQAAIDALAAPAPDTQPGEPAGGNRIAADSALVRALGGALANFGIFIEHKGVATVEEISNVLGTYAATVARSSREEGLILEWLADRLGEAAPALSERQDATD